MKINGGRKSHATVPLMRTNQCIWLLFTVLSERTNLKKTTHAIGRGDVSIGGGEGSLKLKERGRENENGKQYG